MKTNFMTILLSLGIIVNSFAQKIDFSVDLACDGLVHTNNSTVIDKDGNIFVAGGTKKGLHVTEDAFQKEFSGHNWIGGGDIFLMKLSPEGELIYSTYIGGSKDEYYCNQIAIDNDGNVYVGFTTDSPDLPVSDNAYQKSLNGSEDDHYIIKFSNDCKYISSTYLGGSGSDHWTRLAVNNSILYLVGCTQSIDFPTTADVIQEKYNNWIAPDSTLQWMVKDISITALSLDLDKVLYSTYLGGNNYENVNSFTFDAKGKIILAGSTWSDNYPTTKSGYDQSFNGNYDSFLTITDPNLSAIYYSTFLGGDADDMIQSIAQTANDNIIIVGNTKSLNFPITSDALNQEFLGGRTDGFITELNINTNKLVYSTFMGGSGGDRINEVNITDKQEIVLVGVTGSKDFPVTKDALYQSIGGADLVVLKLDKTLKNIEYSTYIGGSGHEYFPNAKCFNSNKLIVACTSTSSDFPVTNKYTEKDSTNMNVLLKFDLINK